MPRAATCWVVDPRTVSYLTPEYCQAVVPSAGLTAIVPALNCSINRPSGQQIGACWSEPTGDPFSCRGLSHTSFRPPTLVELICLSCENVVCAKSPPPEYQLSVIGVSPAGRYAFAVSCAGVTDALPGVVREAEA